MRKLLIYVGIVTIALSVGFFGGYKTQQSNLNQEKANHLNTIKVLSSSIQSYDDLTTTQHDLIISLQNRLKDIK